MGQTRPRPAPPHAGLDGSRGRGRGTVPKQRCRAREGTADRAPAREARPCSPEALVGRPSLEQTEALKQSSSCRHTAGEGSGLVRVLPGRHSGTPVPSSSSPAARAAHATQPFGAGPLCVASPGAAGGARAEQEGPRVPCLPGRCPGLETTGKQVGDSPEVVLTRSARSALSRWRWAIAACTAPS